MSIFGIKKGSVNLQWYDYTCLPSQVPVVHYGPDWSIVVGSTGWDTIKQISGTSERGFFAITQDGDLRLYSYPADAPGYQTTSTDLPTPPNWDNQTTKIVGGENGVLYAINSDNRLMWYDCNLAGKSWAANSGTDITPDMWDDTISEFASGPNGVLYAIVDDDLLWYRYIPGTNKWAPGSGTVIGSTGWISKKIIAGPSNAIFAITPAGDLLWYAYPTTDSNPDPSAWIKGTPTVIGSTGWDEFRALAVFLDPKN